ncbi:hypothetical protein IEQ34_011883 [Dendrobium chrysotoxum]|uniref:Uncharacterized protein n=1 Tax=Dendrobium chrysotoxum TaxID=161865 RepID=A0AAV7GTJ3_DENCH|nr:hypothetical protein IEQ34_011883 [Dendrobium chrysotoxum]
MGENPSSRDPTIKGDPATPNDGERKPNKGARVDEVVSTVTIDSLIILYKKFHFSNDLIVTIPKRSDRACLPQGTWLSTRPICESKWLDFHTRDPSRSWASAFFFVKNDWGLIEKWEKIKDLPAPLQVGEEDILRILNILDIEYILYEVYYLNKFIEEEFLLKVGLSFQAGRPDARMLKKSSKVLEPHALASKIAPKRQERGDNPQASLKKNKLDGVATSIS